MKLLFLFFCLCSMPVLGQSSIFERLTLMAMEDGRLMFNIDGYDILGEIIEADLDSEEFKNYLIKNNLVGTFKHQNPHLKYPHFFFSWEYYQQKEYEKYDYFVKIPNEKAVFMFSFVGLAHEKPTLQLHKDLIESVFEHHEKFQEVQLGINDFSFLGRKIQIPSECKWTYINSLQCPKGGQISWSVYADKNEAQRNSDFMQKKLSKNPEIYQVEENRVVDLIFEGVKIQAKELKIKVIPKNKTLISYYIVENIRGRNVFCQLSFYLGTPVEKGEDFPYFIGNFIKKPENN